MNTKYLLVLLCLLIVSSAAQAGNDLQTTGTIEALGGSLDGNDIYGGVGRVSYEASGNDLDKECGTQQQQRVRPLFGTDPYHVHSLLVGVNPCTTG